MQTQQTPPADTLIRLPEVIRRTGLSRTTIYRRVKAAEFPQPVPLSKSLARRAPVAWSLAEVLAWIEACKQARTEVAA